MNDTLKKVAEAMQKDPAVAAAVGLAIDMTTERARLALTTMAASDKPVEALSDVELALELGLSAERLKLMEDSGLSASDVVGIAGELLGVAARGVLKGATGV